MEVHFVESTCFVLSSSNCIINAGSPGLPPVPLTARESHREREDLGGSGSSITSGPASARNGSGSRSGSRGLAPKEKGKPPMPKVGKTFWSVSYLFFSVLFFFWGCCCYREVDGCNFPTGWNKAKCVKYFEIYYCKCIDATCI